MKRKTFSMNDALRDESLYRLHSVSALNDRQYLVNLTREGRSIEAVCEVKTVDAPGLERLELVEFQSEEFNRLSTLGEVYAKPLGTAILAFHACRAL